MLKIKNPELSFYFFIVSAMVWYECNFCSIKTDWVLFFLINLFWCSEKRPHKFWQSEQTNTYNTCSTPFLGGFLRSQAHNLLTCEQSDPKDDFSLIEKIRHFDPFWRNGSLKRGIREYFPVFYYLTTFWPNFDVLQ